MLRISCGPLFRQERLRRVRKPFPSEIRQARLFLLFQRQKTDFVNLPELFKDVQFDENENYNESLDAIQYFSNADINAKGYQIQTFLELDKSGNTGILGTYVAEQKMYGSQINVTLQPRSIENCYDLIPVYDYDEEYTAYISENMIYLYPINITDEALNQEIHNNCPNSVNQLSSDIKPIEMW